MITVKFTTTKLLSTDGLNVLRYNAGGVHVLPDEIAHIALNNGWAEIAKPDDRETKIKPPVETKEVAPIKKAAPKKKAKE